MILDGERQVAPTLDGIRADHTARYRWAATRIPAGSCVLDVACGIGYGSRILGEAGHIVVGVDIDEDAIRYGSKFHAHPLVRLKAGDANALTLPSPRDAAVSFETVEHLEDPAPLLRSLAQSAPLLIASVPNEAVIPHDAGFAYHFRHYTREQFGALLARCGWRVIEWWGQIDHESDVERDVEGRTLIAVATREQQVDDMPANDEAPDTDAQPAPAERGPIVLTGCGPSGVAPFDHYADPPEHVAILGLGPSVDQYLDVTKRMGGRHPFCDETWGINALGAVLYCDRVFHMDDVRVQMRRAEALPESNIARMVEWMRFHPGPIITSRAHEEFPGLVEFPLQDFLQKYETPYFNSTAAYALCYAMLIGVKRVSLFGCDFTYPNQHDAEKGRGCLEFWIGFAMGRGMKIAVSQRSTLLDAMNTQAERLYGYDTLDVTLRTEHGRAVVDYVERDAPSAEEVEARYDHSRHPNAIVNSASQGGDKGA